MQAKLISSLFGYPPGQQVTTSYLYQSAFGFRVYSVYVDDREIGRVLESELQF